jgi:hypothetical protein
MWIGHGRKWKYPCMCPDGLKNPRECPLVKPFSRPIFEPETLRNKVRNHTDLFGDEQF